MTEAKNGVRNIARGLGSLTFQNIIGSILAFVFYGAILRLSSPLAVGGYSAVLIAVSIASPLCIFGLSTAATRYVAFYERSNASERWNAARAAFVLTIISAAIISLVFVGLSQFMSVYFMKNSQYTGLFVLGGVWLFTSGLASTLQGIIHGLKRYTLTAKILLSSRFIMSVFAIAGLAIYHDVIFAVAAWIVYNGIILVWSYKVVGSELIHAEGSKPYTAIFRYALPLGLAAILAALATNIDSFVVGGYLSPISLAVYNTAIYISSILNVIVIVPLTTMTLPEASSRSHAITETSSVLRLGLRFLFLGILPSSFFLAALSTQLLTVFSSGGVYLGAVPSLELISVSYVFFGIQVLITHILMAIGRTKRALVVTIFSAGIDATLSILLVSEFSIVGAAIAKDTAMIFGMVVAIFFVREYLHKLDPFMFYGKVLIAATLPAFVIFVLSTELSNRTVSLIPYSLIGGLLFLSCVKGMKILTEEDRSFLSHLLPSFLHKLLRII